jgi:glycosyltransferase involved in cell wall biosynthesis
VSIGLPVYNGERYLEQSIQSVLSQTYRDLELIVSDNASTDATLAIIERAAERDGRVIVLRNEVNQGAARNYNLVFEHARGEFFRWHAHDDLMEPELIERLVDQLDADPDCVLAHSWTRFIDDAGSTTRIFEDDLHVSSPSASRRLTAIVRHLTYCNAVFGLVRRDVLERTALIASFPGSDVPLLYELAVAGRFDVVAEPLFVRRPGRSLVANPSNRSMAAWFGPDARGALLPGFWLWWATVGAIWRSSHPVATRLGTLATFNVVWPAVRVRRWTRERRSRQAGGSA